MTPLSLQGVAYEDNPNCRPLGHGGWGLCLHPQKCCRIPSAFAERSRVITPQVIGARADKGHALNSEAGAVMVAAWLRWLRGASYPGG